MAFGSSQTITIQRSIPVVNGYAQVPPNFETAKTSKTIADLLGIAGAKLVRLSPDTGGYSTAGRWGVQEFIQLPTVLANEIDAGYEEIIEIPEPAVTPFYLDNLDEPTYDDLSILDYNRMQQFN